LTITGASFTNSPSGPSNNFAFSSIKIYSDTGAYVESYALSGVTSTINDIPGIFNSAYIQPLTLGPGKYTIAVDGVASGGSSVGIGSNISFSAAVPEPATWGMMIVGLGMVGATLRTRARKSALMTA
jgi:hypothetical protein